MRLVPDLVLTDAGWQPGRAVMVEGGRIATIEPVHRLWPSDVMLAARRVGIRLVLARAMYDWEGAPRRYRETVADAARRTRELIAAHRGDATTRVQPAPHSPHGASSAMIRAGWEVAEAEQVPFHIHVAEGRDEG